jgi:predicted small secreted protein
MRKSLAQALLTLMLLSGAGALLGACHTVEGAGQDVSSTGHAIGHAVGTE